MPFTCGWDRDAQHRGYLGKGKTFPDGDDEDLIVAAQGGEHLGEREVEVVDGDFATHGFVDEAL